MIWKLTYRLDNVVATALVTGGSPASARSALESANVIPALFQFVTAEEVRARVLGTEFAEWEPPLIPGVLPGFTLDLGIRRGIGDIELPAVEANSAELVICRCGSPCRDLGAQYASVRLAGCTVCDHEFQYLPEKAFELACQDRSSRPSHP